jgi:hypothetical protein
MLTKLGGAKLEISRQTRSPPQNTETHPKLGTNCHILLASNPNWSQFVVPGLLA